MSRRCSPGSRSEPTTARNSRGTGCGTRSGGVDEHRKTINKQEEISRTNARDDGVEVVFVNLWMATRQDLLLRDEQIVVEENEPKFGPAVPATNGRGLVRGVKRSPVDEGTPVALVTLPPPDFSHLDDSPLVRLQIEINVIPLAPPKSQLSPDLPSLDLVTRSVDTRLDGTEHAPNLIEDDRQAERVIRVGWSNFEKLCEGELELRQPRERRNEKSEEVLLADGWALGKALMDGGRVSSQL